MQITTNIGTQVDTSTIRGGRIPFTEDVANGYDFVKGESTKVHYSTDSGACIFWPDEIRLNGEITEDVMKTLIWMP